MVKTAWRKKDLLRQSLLGMAHNLGPGVRMPTVAALCDGFSVSTSTLDPILRDLEKRGAIRREQGRGIFVSPTIRHKTVGVVFGGDIFSSHFSPFWGLLLDAIRQQASGHRIQPRAYMDISDRGEPTGHVQLLQDIEERRLDGLLLFAPQFQYDEAFELRTFGLPLVVLGGQTPDNWSVTLNWDGFLDRAAADLAGTDCRRVGLIAVSKQQTALERALRAAGLGGVYIDDWSYETWADIIPGAGSHEHCAHRLTERMLAERAANPLPDALVSLDDTATRGVVTALLAAGLRPGRDIRIVTAENKGSPVLDPLTKDLRRIAFDPAMIVRAALGMLETVMDGRTPEENPVRVGPEEGVRG